MKESCKEYLVALAGNPNCGKSTLFNAITGARQHVSNYPGITVEKKEGFHRHNGCDVRLVDLPGTYSLTAYSLEELVARDYLVNARPQVAINIVDASNLDRNLYLTVQLLELGAPVVLALNMMDVAAGRGMRIDADELSRRLGVAVVPMVARTGEGKERLLQASVERASREASWQPLYISYGPDIDPVLKTMEEAIREKSFLADFYPPRWTALKYLENDEAVMKQGREADPILADRLRALADEVTSHLQKTLDTYPEAIIADHRYGFIAALLRGGVVEQDRKSDRLEFSDRLDRVLTNRFFGPLIMLLVLYGVYQFTFRYSELPVAWMEKAFALLGRGVESVVPQGLLRSLLVSGVIDGVGGVLGFVPLILLLFLAIAFLEDTGYLARVAYMLDRVFRVFGLHGNSVMAYIISGGIMGGCAVPGVMAARTLRSPRERIATLITAPFMNCGAKIPVFAMLIAAFFAAHKARVMFLLTLFSWIVALLMARLLRSTLLRGPSTPFLLELPPYRLPTFKGLLIHTWERTWQYIRKAGTVILAFSILLWALMTFPTLPGERRAFHEQARKEALASVPPAARTRFLQGDATGGGDAELEKARERLARIDRAESREALKHSLAGRLGTGLEGITRWCGFEWQVNIALVGGFAAKELILSTLGTAYSLGEGSEEADGALSRRLARDPRWDRLKAVSLIVFIMLYAPCFVTVSCIIRESSWGWGLFSIAFNTGVAFVVAALVYQGGLWLGLGG